MLLCVEDLHAMTDGFHDGVFRACEGLLQLGGQVEFTARTEERLKWGHYAA